MNDVDRKIKTLVAKINDELNTLGTNADISIGSMVTEDTSENYITVQVGIGSAVFAAHASSNPVGIKTFLQGFMLASQLMTGNYRMKPLNEYSRRHSPSSIILKRNPEIKRGSMSAPSSIKPRTHPRFTYLRNKFNTDLWT